MARRLVPLCSLLVLLLVLLGAASGQRAVVSLGRKIQNRFSRGATATTSVPGEDDFTSSDFYHAAATLVAALIGSYALLVAKRKGTLPDDSDDIVVKDDRVVNTIKEVDLAFDGLKLVLRGKKGADKQILDGSVRGRAKPGRMLAILGPSGAGKSSVLHAIAGRIKDSSKLTLSGTRLVNGVAVSGDSMVPAAFIEQDVAFFPHMTVRETLSFRVELKLGSLLSKTARDAVVADLLAELGLTRAAETIVGDQKVRGISGGERKRLSIAVEMISSPSVVALDEPTSGLDSTAATTLMKTLRKMADAGKTVIAVIHQPNQHVFSLFDDVLLVSEGKQMYFGPRDRVRAYMESLGCKASSEMGTAEHILDCISRSPIGDETEDEANERIDMLATKAGQAKIDFGEIVQETGAVRRFTALGSGGHGPRANLLVQSKLLFQRSIREVSRAKAAIVLGLVRQITTAVIYGGIYSLGTNQASIQDRFGLLSLIAIGSMNMAMAATIRTFPKEKAIVSNELGSNMYRTLPYFVGKAISELPLVGFFNSIFGLVVYQLTGMSRTAGKLRNFLGILTMHGILSQAAGLVVGAISPNSDVALAIFPAIVVLNIIFDGKNISEENTPKLLRWIPKIGLVRWGFEGLCINEFEGLEFESSGPMRGPVAKTGADALARFGLGTRSLGDVLGAQLIMAGACWFMSYLGLTLSRQKYLTMEPMEGKE